MDINEFKEFMDVSEFKGYFVTEANEHLQKMNDNLLALEKNPQNKDLLKELMRSSHTIKGSAATMNYNKVAFLAHILEDVFDSATNDLVKINPVLIAELLKGADALQNAVNSIDKTGVEIDLEPASQKIKSLTGVTTQGIGKSIRNTEGKPVAAPAAAKPSSTIQPAAQSQPVNATATAQIAAVETISHIKVPVGRLDTLLALTEELLITRMKLDQLKNTHLFLREPVEHLSRLVSDIQYQVMKVRLIAVDQIFARFPRMVHDLAAATGKTVNFTISGGEIELDRTIVDKLGEPLIHLLRNAVDHGIDKEGTVTLKAMRQKDRVLISVENSGNAINYDKVREKAIQKGVVSAEEGKKLNKDQLIQLILTNRLSTSETITEISGRGVGMGIVKNFVDEIGGRLIVESPVRNNSGTRFTLELPLTIAIINALLVKVAGKTFAVPFSDILRSVIIDFGDIKSLADQEVAIVGKTDVPLIRLAEIFSLKGREDRVPDGKVLAVIVSRGEDIAGLVVDSLINKEEIIVKPFSPVLRKTKGFSGSTILGDGETILIVDVLTLLENARKNTSTINAVEAN